MSDSSGGGGAASGSSPAAAASSSTSPPPVAMPKWQQQLEAVKAAAAAQGKTLDSLPELPDVTIVPSLCMACGEEGETRLLLTDIPYFRSVVLASFSCPSCNMTNNEISSMTVAERGTRMRLHVPNGLPARVDLDRQVVISPFARVTVPQLDLEIPPRRDTQPGRGGRITTVEGILTEAVEGMRHVMRENAAALSPEQLAAIGSFVLHAEQLARGMQPFDVEIDDPAGQSYVQNPQAPSADPRLKTVHYRRSAADDDAVGLSAENQAAENAALQSEQGVGRIYDSDELAHIAERVASSGTAAAAAASSTVAGGSGSGSGGGSAVSTPHNRAASDRKDPVGHRLPRAAALVGDNILETLGGGTGLSNGHGGDAAAAAATAAEVASDGTIAAAGVPGVERVEVIGRDEVLRFPTLCTECRVPGETRMHLTQVPYFKEVVIMSFVCDGCGFRSNEARGAGAIAPRGTRIELQVRTTDDLSRDILLSETASVRIPVAELELATGTLGGRFTSVEGLVQAISDQLSSTAAFAFGDSSDNAERRRMSELLATLADLKQARQPWLLIIDDLTSKSFVEQRPPDDRVDALAAAADQAAAESRVPPSFDDAMLVVEYERSDEQNDELGLKDMDTEAHVTYGDQ